jgi:thiol-disulfide isomerase/thioredoxin
MNKLLLIVILAVLSAMPVMTQERHEYSPMVENTVNYKTWKLNDLQTDQPADLRTLVAGKKLVLVVYFAPWCPNWKYDAPVIAKLLDKYKAQGLGVIAVSEYGSRDEARKFFDPNGLPYPVVSESESRDDREKTLHFGYRQATGDTRKWGSPWHIFLDPSKLNKDGEILTEKAWVVNGELIEADVDKFIGDYLKPAATAAIEPCKP